MCFFLNESLKTSKLSAFIVYIANFSALTYLFCCIMIVMIWCRITHVSLMVYTWTETDTLWLAPVVTDILMLIKKDIQSMRLRISYVCNATSMLTININVTDTSVFFQCTCFSKLVSFQNATPFINLRIWLLFLLRKRKMRDC